MLIYSIYIAFPPFFCNFAILFLVQQIGRTRLKPNAKNYEQ